MDISHTYIHNILGILVPEVPKDHNKLNDEAFKKIITINGGHQRVISVARCPRLSSRIFDCLSMCKGLVYLNISYTSISDLSPLTHCEVLRALVAAGVRCSSYIDLQYLTSLELLNLAFSSIVNTDSLRDLIRLRSLDLGHTLINSLSGVERLTRLEELLIDTTALSEECLPRVSQQLKTMRQLRLVNVGDTLLSRSHRDLLSACCAAVQWTSRSLKWFEGIVANDATMIRSLIANGFDVNLRVASWEKCPSVISLLTETWRQRCQGTTPFFDLQHPKHRPAAIHLAVYFNSVDCLKLLVQNQVIIASCCV